MDKEKQPGIKFDSIMLVKEEFYRDSNVNDEAVPDLKIYMNWGNQNNSYIVEINTILRLIDEEKEKLKLDYTFVGIFSIIEGSENMVMEDFFKNNSAAIMFPYMRTYNNYDTKICGHFYS